MLTITYYEIVTLHSIPELYLVFHQDWVLDTYTEEKTKKELEARKEFFLARETSNHSPAPFMRACYVSQRALEAKTTVTFPIKMLTAANKATVRFGF